MPMQILRSTTTATPVPLLAEGQLAVELAQVPPRLWCGAPISIDADQRVQLNLWPTQTQLGGPFLPLSGGMLTRAADSTTLLDINNVGTGNSLLVHNAGTTHLTVAANGTTTLTTVPNNNGLIIDNTGTGSSFIVRSGATNRFIMNAAGQLAIYNNSGSSQLFLSDAAGSTNQINLESAWTGQGFLRFRNTSANIHFLRSDTGAVVWSTTMATPSVRISNGVYGTGPAALEILEGAFPKVNIPNLDIGWFNGGQLPDFDDPNYTNSAFRVRRYTGVGFVDCLRIPMNSGVVTSGTPTGPAVTGEGNINVSGGYYVNGVAVGASTSPLNFTSYNNLLPADGDLWYDGSHLKFQMGATTMTLIDDGVFI